MKQNRVGRIASCPSPNTAARRPPPSLRRHHRQRHAHRSHRHQRPRDCGPARRTRARRRAPDHRAATSGRASERCSTRCWAAMTSTWCSPRAARGSAARDGTYEVVSARIEKRLDGFGELFRMLSYADVGPAAMLSRACAGLARRRILVAHARLGSSRAPGHAQAAAAGARAPRPRGAPLMPLRPDRTIVTIAEARAILAASGDRSRAPNGSRSTTSPAACSPTTSMRPIDVPSVRPRGHGRLRRRRRRHDGRASDAPVTLTLVDSVYTGDAPGHHLTPAAASASPPARRSRAGRTRSS